MKNTIKIAFAIVFCLMLGVAANAQLSSSGSIDFSIVVPKASDLRAGGPPSVNVAEVSVGGTTTAGSVLSATLAIADAGPTSVGPILASVPIRMRSNSGYKLTAARSNTDLMNPAALDSSDITMGITFTARCTPSVTCLVEPGADNTAGGLATIASLGSGAFEIANGARISTSGGTGASEPNYVVANLNFAVPRQFYTPATYLNTITLSIATP